MSTVHDKKQQGFTLIELLVAMAIATILVTFSTFAIRGARESARDGRRRSDLQNIQSNLEIYKSDCDAYPLGVGRAHTELGDPFTGCTGNTYMDDVPQDILSDRYYFINSDGTNYQLCARMEDTTSTGCVGQSCGSAGDCNYEIRNR